MRSIFYLMLGLLLCLLMPISCSKDDSTTMVNEFPTEQNAQPGDNLIIYVNLNEKNHWNPDGWMPEGITQAFDYQDDYKENPHSMPESIKIGVSAKNFVNGWAGIYWLSDGWDGPGININEELHLSNMNKVSLVFWARGGQGGERVKFLAGGVECKAADPNCDQAYKDSFKHETSWFSLSSDWTEYEIDLTAMNLTEVGGGFGFVVDEVHNRGKEKFSIFP